MDRDRIADGVGRRGVVDAQGMAGGMGFEGDDAVVGRIGTELRNLLGADKYDRFFGDGGARLRREGGVLYVVAPNDYLSRWMRSWVEGALISVVRVLDPERALAIEWVVDDGCDGGEGARCGAAGGDHAAAGVRGGIGLSNGAGGVVGSEGASGRIGDGAVGGSARTGRSGGRWRRETAARYRLEDFVVGDSNRLAYTAACSMANEDGPGGFGALVLHGECGLGKTHLLSGVLRRLKERHPGVRARYVTGEEFANEFIASLGAHTIDRFRRRYRGLDLLCIDDVHFLAGKKKTMAELEHTFEALDLAGARVALASDAHPCQLEDFSRRLMERLSGGMAVRLQKPDRATRLKIVERLAVDRGLAIDGATIRTVADSCVNSVREIQGALARLEALATLGGMGVGSSIDPVLARRAVSGDAPARGRRPIRVDSITHAVCQTLGVEVSDVLGRGRHKRVVLARSLSAWLSRELTSHSYPEIAKLLHRPSHSTVVTQCQKVQRQIDAGLAVDAGPEFDGVRLADFCERLRNQILRGAAERGA